MKNMMIEVAGIVILLTLGACTRPLAGELRTGNVAPRYLTCKRDTDCHEVPRALRCCSGCGVSPGETIALNRQGYDVRQEREKEVCAGKKCPHFICPLRESCTRSHPVCHARRCAV